MRLERKPFWVATMLLAAGTILGGCGHEPARTKNDVRTAGAARSRSTQRETRDNASAGANSDRTILAYLEHNPGMKPDARSHTVIYFYSGRVVEFELGGENVREGRLRKDELQKLRAELAAAKLTQMPDGLYFPPDGQHTLIEIRAAEKLRYWGWTETDSYLPSEISPQFKQAWKEAKDLLTVHTPTDLEPVSDPHGVYDAMLKILHSPVNRP